MRPCRSRAETTRESQISASDICATHLRKVRADGLVLHAIEVDNHRPLLTRGRDIEMFSSASKSPVRVAVNVRQEGVRFEERAQGFTADAPFSETWVENTVSGAVRDKHRSGVHERYQRSQVGFDLGFVLLEDATHERK